MHASLMMNTAPDDSVRLTCSHRGANYEREAPLESLNKHGQDITALLAVRYVRDSSSSCVPFAIRKLSIGHFIPDLPDSKVFVALAKHVLVLRVKPPEHLAGRHLPRKNSIYLAADAAANVVLAIHLHLEAYLMEAVVSAFAHDDNINAHFLLHLLFMNSFDITFWLGLKVIIKLAQAYTALFILPGLPMPLLLLFAHLLQKLPHSHLHEFRHRCKFAD